MHLGTPDAFYRHPLQDIVAGVWLLCPFAVSSPGSFAPWFSHPLSDSPPGLFTSFSLDDSPLLNTDNSILVYFAECGLQNVKFAYYLQVPYHLLLLLLLYFVR